MTSYQLKTQTIYCGDNIKMLKDLPDESVDLCYIDPPFNSNRNYEVFWGDVQEKRAFNDRFGDAQEYINYMRPRVIEIYRVLKKTGSFYYHCDWHASHYVKIMLDEIFGFNNFLSEIAWCYRERGISKRYWNRKHDTIFFYAKNEGEHIFNCDDVLEPYSEEYLKKFKYKDDIGYYQIRGRNVKDSPIQRADGLTPKAELQHPGLTYRQYKKEGMLPLDWWVIPLLNKSSKERLGYPTQKPLELIEKIINASSNKGDVVLDAFCGCGTTLVAAQKLNRKWVGVDISPTACRVMSQRLYELFKLREGKDFWVDDLPKTEEELRILPHFEFQNWAVIALGQLTNMSGIPNKIKSGDFGIDGKLYPVELEKKKKDEKDLFGDTDKYYPVQVKQMDKVGRPDIDSFQTAIRRDGRIKGYFVSFDFTKDSMTEIRRLDKDGEIEIIPITVASLLRAEEYKH